MDLNSLNRAAQTLAQRTADAARQAAEDPFGAAGQAVSDAGRTLTTAFEGGEEVREAAVEAAGRAMQAAAPYVDGAIDAGAAVGSFLWDNVTDDEVWGDAISTDNGKDPCRFGYGTLKNTLGEIDLALRGENAGGNVSGFEIPTHNELALKLRAFGHASAENLSASIGLETENGYKGTKENVFASGGRQAWEGFAGLRGRASAEAGVLGVGMDAEAFFGMKMNFDQTPGVQSGDVNWFEINNSAEAGVRGTAAATLDVMSASVDGALQIGLDARTRYTRHSPLGMGVGLMERDQINLFAGARAQGNAEVGMTGVEAGVDVFAGVRAQYQKGLAIAYEGEKLIGGVFEIEGRLGIGANAQADLGMDWDEWTFDLNLEAGAAVGVGVGIGGGVEVGGKQIAKSFGIDPQD